MAPVNGTTNGEKVPKAPMNTDPVPRFALPVDSEHKAKAINLFSFAHPHMRSFHINWIGFFITFLAAYASAPLVPIIRDSINLTQYQANVAGAQTLTYRQCGHRASTRGITLCLKCYEMHV